MTLIPVSSSEFISLSIDEHQYDTKYRNVEGASQIITLDSSPKSTILSLPELEDNSIIVVQLSACIASNQKINYVNLNAFTLDVLSFYFVTSEENLHYYMIDNIFMEIKLELSGAANDQVFVKHMGVPSSYTINYKINPLVFNENTNEVTIIKPIFGEEFTFNVLVGQKDAFKDYNLCTFHQNSINNLGDYVKSFISKDSNQIVHYIDFRSIIKNKYNEGDEFDLIVFATQNQNSKLEFLYNVTQAKVGKVG